MNVPIVVRVLAFALTSSALAAASSPPLVSPFEPIAFLVGGIWRGELPPQPDGTKMSIELRCDWAANHQGIRFDGAFLANGKRSPYTSGIYHWNAAKQQLVFVYSDAEGNLTEGAVASKQGTLIHTFTVTDVRGKIENARAIITPQGPNAYTNDIFAAKEGGFRQIVSVNYRRVSE